MAADVARWRGLHPASVGSELNLELAVGLVALRAAAYALGARRLAR